MDQYIRTLLPLVLVVSSTVVVVPSYAQDNKVSSNTDSTDTSEVMYTTDETTPSELNNSNSSTNSQSSTISKKAKNNDSSVSTQTPAKKSPSTRIPIFSRIFPFAPLMRQ
ncbi:MAG: hypothetical protein QNJ51_30185 [Calothrix sp. MO_167.B12]|nr:hypothetical protein [Calothrix sp. MO_167.B12]